MIVKCVVTLNLSRVFMRGADLCHAFLFARNMVERRSARRVPKNRGKTKLD